MDDLLRPSPVERRNRRIVMLALLGAVVLVVLGAVVVSLLGSVLRREAQPKWPVAYLVPLNGAASVQIGGRTVPLGAPRTVIAGESVALPAGVRVLVVHAKDGRSEELRGPAVVRLDAVEAPDVAVDFLRSPLPVLASAVYQGAAQPSGRVQVTSPFGVTRFTNPTITWEPRLGTRYDVAVVDFLDERIPPRMIRSVLPPVRVDQLETTMARELAPDRIYMVLVAEAGSETQVGGQQFLVAPEATAASLPVSPPELLTEVLSALETKPHRMGDAWLALSRMPPQWAESELVLRLRMWVATELGLQGELAEIQAQLHASPAQRR